MSEFGGEKACESGLREALVMLMMDDDAVAAIGLRHELRSSRRSWRSHMAPLRNSNKSSRFFHFTIDSRLILTQRLLVIVGFSH
jgi:hypothetical protein